jgi:hypothetical protein
MERFSPVFEDSQSFPVRYRQPEASYSLVYPTDVDLTRIAYFFDYEFQERLPDDAYVAIAKQVRRWQDVWIQDGRAQPSMTYWRAPGYLQIDDRRDYEQRGSYTFRDNLAEIYAACSERPRTASGVRSLLALEEPVDAIQQSLEEFCQHGLMMRDGSLYLSLALPANRNR